MSSTLIEPILESASSFGSRESFLAIFAVFNTLWTGLLSSLASCSAVRLQSETRKQEATYFVVPSLIFLSIIIGFALESGFFFKVLDSLWMAASSENPWLDMKNIFMWGGNYFLAYMMFETVTVLLLQLSIVYRMRDLAERVPVLTVSCIFLYTIIHISASVLFAGSLYAAADAARELLLALAYSIMGISIGLAGFSAGLIARLRPMITLVLINDAHHHLCHTIIKLTYVNCFLFNFALLVNVITFMYTPTLLQPLVHVVLSKTYIGQLGHVLHMSDKPPSRAPVGISAPCGRKDVLARSGNVVVLMSDANPSSYEGSLA